MLSTASVEAKSTIKTMWEHIPLSIDKMGLDETRISTRIMGALRFMKDRIHSAVLPNSSNVLCVLMNLLKEKHQLRRAHSVTPRQVHLFHRIILIGIELYCKARIMVVEMLLLIHKHKWLKVILKNKSPRKRPCRVITERRASTLQEKLRNA